MGLFVGAVVIFSSMLLLTPLPLWVSLATLSLIASNILYFSLRDALLVLPWSYVALTVNSKNKLHLLQNNGSLLEVSVKENTVVTPYLTVVNFRLETPTFLQRIFTQSIVILPDSANAEAYRQLRVYLRWAKPQLSPSEVIN